MPLLYLKGISTGKIAETVENFFGRGSMGLSPSTISKLIKIWEKDFNFFKQRRIDRKYVYLWADGVHVNVRLGDDKDEGPGQGVSGQGEFQVCFFGEIS